MFVFGSIGIRYNRESLKGMERYTKQSCTFMCHKRIMARYAANTLLMINQWQVENLPTSLLVKQS
jgi:hypothetical protein